MKNKRGASDMLYGTVLFLVANILFFVIVGVGIAKVGTPEIVKEEAFAKQIALLIDGSNSGTKIEIDVSDLLAAAKENKIDPIIILNCNRNEVFVKVTDASGYSFKYFTESEKCDFSLDKEKRKFIINV